MVNSWSKSIRIAAKGKRIFVAHATSESDEENVPRLFTDETFLDKCKAYDCYIFGHTHLPCVQTVEDILFVNPGSVGGPFDRDTRAAYAAIEITNENIDVQIRRVEYDLNATVQLMRELSVPWSDEIIEVMKRASLF